MEPCLPCLCIFLTHKGAENEDSIGNVCDGYKFSNRPYAAFAGVWYECTNGYGQYVL